MQCSRLQPTQSVRAQRVIAVLSIAGEHMPANMRSKPKRLHATWPDQATCYASTMRVCWRHRRPPCRPGSYGKIFSPLLTPGSGCNYRGGRRGCRGSAGSSKGGMGMIFEALADARQRLHRESVEGWSSTSWGSGPCQCLRRKFARNNKSTTGRFSWPPG